MRDPFQRERHPPPGQRPQVCFLETRRWMRATPAVFSWGVGVKHDVLLAMEWIDVLNWAAIDLFTATTCRRLREAGCAT